MRLQQVGDKDLNDIYRLDSFSLLALLPVPLQGFMMAASSSRVYTQRFMTSETVVDLSRIPHKNVRFILDLCNVIC